MQRSTRTRWPMHRDGRQRGDCLGCWRRSSQGSLATCSESARSFLPGERRCIRHALRNVADSRASDQQIAAAMRGNGHLLPSPTAAPRSGLFCASAAWSLTRSLVRSPISWSHRERVRRLPPPGHKRQRPARPAERNDRVLDEDVRVRDPDGSVRLHELPLAIFANKDTGHPHRPLAAARTRETPAPLSPGDIALDVNVEFVGYRLDVVPAGGGYSIHDLIARVPLFGVSPDMDGIGTLREHGTQPGRVTSVLRLERLVDHLADLVLGPSSGHVFPPQSGWRQSSVVPAAGARNRQAREFRRGPTPLPARVFSRLFARAAGRYIGTAECLPVGFLYDEIAHLRLWLPDEMPRHLRRRSSDRRA